VLAQEMKLSPL